MEMKLNSAYEVQAIDERQNSAKLTPPANKQGLATLRIFRDVNADTFRDYGN